MLLPSKGPEVHEGATSGLTYAGYVVGYEALMGLPSGVAYCSRASSAPWKEPLSRAPALPPLPGPGGLCANGKVEAPGGCAAGGCGLPDPKAEESAAVA